MISGIGSTLSALNAFGTKMEVTAQNTANLQSEEYKSLEAIFTGGDTGSVEVTLSESQAPGPLISVQENGQTVEKELSNVDLAEEISDTVLTSTGYDANLRVLSTRDEMLGSLLDIVG